MIAWRSRNGFARTEPLLMTLTRPVCSTTNNRPLPSPAFVTRTGLLKPLATSDRDRSTAAGSNAAFTAVPDTTASPVVAITPSAGTTGASVLAALGGPARWIAPWAPIETRTAAARTAVRRTTEDRSSGRRVCVTAPPPANPAALTPPSQSIVPRRAIPDHSAARIGDERQQPARRPVGTPPNPRNPMLGWRRRA